MERQDMGPVDVDCTGMAGVTFSVSEHRPYMRPGVRIRTIVPFDGEDEMFLQHLPFTRCGVGDRVLRCKSEDSSAPRGARTAIRCGVPL
jgi:hypothetical protein